MLHIPCLTLWYAWLYLIKLVMLLHPHTFYIINVGALLQTVYGDCKNCMRIMSSSHLSCTDKNNPRVQYSHMKTTRECFRAITTDVKFICFDFNALWFVERFEICWNLWNSKIVQALYSSSRHLVAKLFTYYI